MHAQEREIFPPLATRDYWDITRRCTRLLMVVTAESTCNNRDPLLGAYIVSLFGLYAAAINRVIQVYVAFSWGIF